VSILNATAPLWTVLLAHFLTQDERLNISRLSGVLLGIIGVVIIIGPDDLKAFGSNVLTQLAVVGAAFSYALAGIFGKRFKNLSPYVTATGQITCSALIMIPVAPLVDKPWMMHLPGPRIWGSVIALALVCTALAYVIYSRILATAGATNLLLVTFLIPASALFLGIFLLGERLELRHFAGMAFIGFGLAAIDGRAKKLLSREDQEVQRLLRKNSKHFQVLLMIIRYPTNLPHMIDLNSLLRIDYLSRLKLDLIGL
jgi:drug/metabolite transporter (DMT)-like permease